MMAAEQALWEPAFARRGPTSTGWRVRKLALLVLAVVYPFHYYVTGGGEETNVSLGDGVIAVVVAAACAGVLWGRVALPRYLKALMVLVAVAFASLMAPVLRPGAAPPYFDPTFGLVGILKVLGSAAWMVAIYALLRHRPIEGIKVFSVASIATASVFALLTIHESLTLSGTRPAGPFENENLYANYLTLNLFLIAILARFHGIERPHRAWVLPWIIVPLLSVGVLATGSRGALIGAVASYPLAFRWRLRGRLSLKHATGVLITMALTGYGLATFWHTNTFIAERVSSIFTGEGPNITNREALWHAASEAFLSSPVLGIGYHQFPSYAALEFGLKNTVPHNTYLSFGAELGLAGLAALFGFFWVVMRDGWRMGQAPETSAARLLVLLMMATLVQGLFADVEHYRSLWIAMGMLAALREWRGSRRSGEAVTGAVD